MKIVIDIPEEEYHYVLKSDNSAFADCVSKECMMYAIKNGIPLDHLTNGQVAKEIFGLHSNALSWNIRTQQWWNAPFKKTECDTDADSN